jgi:hypothetical protein
MASAAGDGAGTMRILTPVTGSKRKLEVEEGAIIQNTPAAPLTSGPPTSGSVISFATPPSVDDHHIRLRAAQDPSGAAPNELGCDERCYACIPQRTHKKNAAYSRRQDGTFATEGCTRVGRDKVLKTRMRNYKKDEVCGPCCCVCDACNRRVNLYIEKNTMQHF